jgi:hypothetical protein
MLLIQNSCFKCYVISCRRCRLSGSPSPSPPPPTPGSDDDVQSWWRMGSGGHSCPAGFPQRLKQSGPLTRPTRGAVRQPGPLVLPGPGQAEAAIYAAPTPPPGPALEPTLARPDTSPPPAPTPPAGSRSASCPAPAVTPPAPPRMPPPAGTGAQRRQPAAGGTQLRAESGERRAGRGKERGGAEGGHLAIRADLPKQRAHALSGACSVRGMCGDDDSGGLGGASEARADGLQPHRPNQGGGCARCRRPEPPFSPPLPVPPSPRPSHPSWPAAVRC